MKKYILVLFVFFCFSCTDVLDRAPSGNLTMDEIYADPELVEGLLAACYDKIPTKGCSAWVYDNGYVAGSDDGWSSADAFPGYAMFDVYIDAHYNPSTYHGLFTFYAEGGIGNNQPWKTYFTQIRLCNQFIENVDKMSFNASNPKEKLVAEAYVLRALYYLELMKLFGSIPIFDQTIPFDADYTNMPNLVRRSVYEVAQAIIADCDYALESGALPWRQTSSNEALRATNALAWALKSTAILFAASPLHNQGQDHWTEAYQICKQAVNELKNTGGYRLFTEADKNLFGDYDGAAYHQLACQSATSEVGLNRDRETIFQHVRASAGNDGVPGNGWFYNYVGVLDGAYQAGTCPTQELVDAYETIDGQPVLDLSKPYLDEEMHLQPNYNRENTLYNPNDPYANRDPRFHATILKNGDRVVWNNGEVFTVDAYVGGMFAIRAEGTPEYMLHSSRTGYYARKMVTPGASATNPIPSSPAKHYRLAEILLNLAETANEAGQTGDALAAVNEVRARVNMPPITTTNKERLRERIHNERRVELAFEGQRYFDLRRWSKPTDDLGKYQKYLTAMWITRNEEDGTFSYQRKNIWNRPRGGWANRELFAPIDYAEASRLEIITGVKWQNPGW
ncbi:MAG: RagB/SusD family nutrient uptake outer membrane protein [Prevotella sp.]|jgi:hypothetical protein|nr:RagB/SusD family nutrient uptake outer membrane protein [Prevotella sp.]MDR2001432.1 RagB/SusD family nutrient uptake outer membrane protein [Prevotella sp.]